MPLQMENHHHLIEVKIRLFKYYIKIYIVSHTGYWIYYVCHSRFTPILLHPEGPRKHLLQ